MYQACFSEVSRLLSVPRKKPLSMAPAVSTAALIEDDPWDMPELQDTGDKWAGMLNVCL